MYHLLTKLYVKLQGLKDESGQDMVEYALIVALIALAATAGMTALAVQINAAFASVGATLALYT